MLQSRLFADTSGGQPAVTDKPKLSLGLLIVGALALVAVIATPIIGRGTQPVTPVVANPPAAVQTVTIIVAETPTITLTPPANLTLTAYLKMTLTQLQREVEATSCLSAQELYGEFFRALTATASVMRGLGITPTKISTRTPTPLPPGTPRTDAHGIAQVWVPAGCFMMGSDSAKDIHALEDEQPQHQVCITQGYWLDTYEVTNAAFDAFVKAGGYTTQAYWSDEGWSWKQNSKITGSEDYDGVTAPLQPRVDISWFEAEAYAKWRGGRLPTEAEWEYAARGPDSLIYPWGDTWDGSKANTAENRYKETRPVGRYESSKSWVGAYDLAGNVWEWVADWYSDTYYQSNPQNDPAGPSSGQSRVLRGGSWLESFDVARAASRGRIDPVLQGNTAGFRIVTPVQ